jgi:hypothetical protein
MLFGKNFDGFQAQVENVLIHVTNYSIGTTCHLPVQGEIWWNKTKLSTEPCNQFMVPKHHDPD